MYLSIRGTVVFLFFLTPNSDPAMMILSTSHPEVDVLIVGAGPAGLLCADALAVANVTVRIVDKRPSKVTVGQADRISFRTIEALFAILLSVNLLFTSSQSYGIAERLLRGSCQVYMAVRLYAIVIAVSLCFIDLLLPSKDGGTEVYLKRSY